MMEIYDASRCTLQGQLSVERQGGGGWLAYGSALEKALPASEEADKKGKKQLAKKVTEERNGL